MVLATKCARARVRIADGQVIWSTDSDPLFETPAACGAFGGEAVMLDHGRASFGIGVESRNAETGKYAGTSRQLAAVAGDVHVRVASQSVYAETGDHELLWRYSDTGYGRNGAAATMPMIIGRTVWFYDATGLVALDLTTGGRIWHDGDRAPYLYSEVFDGREPENPYGARPGLVASGDTIALPLSDGTVVYREPDPVVDPPVRPQTSIPIRPPSFTRSSRAEFGLKSSLAGSTFLCSLDGVAMSPCSGPGPRHIVSDLTDGAHSLLAVAVSPEGQRGLPATASFTVDTRSPIARISLAGTGRKRELRFTSNEPLRELRCSFDRSPFRPCAHSLRLRAAPTDAARIRVRVCDRAGNWSETEQKRLSRMLRR
jgi:hypothetical protein